MAHIYVEKRKKKFEVLKRLAILRGKEIDKTFRPLYDSELLNDLYYNEKIDVMFEYLWSLYSNFDRYQSYNNRGYKDPCLNFCISKCAADKNPINREILISNWDAILSHALKKFRSHGLRMFDYGQGVKFSTFFNNTFPQFFQYEFLEYMRPRVLEKKRAEEELFSPIEEEYSYDENFQVVKLEQLDFIDMLRKPLKRES